MTIRNREDEVWPCIAGCGSRTVQPDDTCRRCLRADPDDPWESELGPLAASYEYDDIPDGDDPWLTAGGDDCYA